MSCGENVFKVGSLSFEALGDRVLIQEDEFKSGYECGACGGSGSLMCDACGGGGHSLVVQNARCSTCEGSGKLRCEECGGTGGLLAIPEVTQRRPTSGKVVSIGADVTTLHVGDSVLYSNFSGYVVDLTGAVMRILHETEILCRLEGQLELRSLKGKSEIAVFNN